MNKKRILLTVLAMVLVCVLSVAGTLALLAEERSITNTFVASGGPGPFVDQNGFSIKEHGLTKDDFGKYTLNTAEITTGNTYDVVPGVTLPKDPYVELKRTSDAPAYLFVEVVNEAPAAFKFDIDDTNWKSLGIKGKNNGDLYVYSTDKTNAHVLGSVTTAATYNIIKNQEVKVENAESAQALGLVDANGQATNKTIKFYAYICQATVAKADGTNTSDPAEVFGICFPNT